MAEKKGAKAAPVKDSGEVKEGEDPLIFSKNYSTYCKYVVLLSYFMSCFFLV